MADASSVSGATRGNFLSIALIGLGARADARQGGFGPYLRLTQAEHSQRAKQARIGPEEIIQMMPRVRPVVKFLGKSGIDFLVTLALYFILHFTGHDPRGSRMACADPARLHHRLPCPALPPAQCPLERSQPPALCLRPDGRSSGCSASHTRLDRRLGDAE